MPNNNLTETSKKISQTKSQLKSGLLSWENWFFYFITLIILFWSIFINKLYPDKNYSLYGFIIIMGMIYVFPFILWFFLKIYLLRDLEKIKSINIYLTHDINKLSNPEEILFKTQALYKTLKRLIFYRRIWFDSFTLYLYKWRYDLINGHFWWQRKLQWNLEWLYINESFIIYELLRDLRSDLSIRLTEQQKTLEQAKSEVEKNIKWTTELNQVSELQRARLDRQIEQFEELQRVLVKV